MHIIPSFLSCYLPQGPCRVEGSDLPTFRTLYCFHCKILCNFFTMSSSSCHLGNPASCSLFSHHIYSWLAIPTPTPTGEATIHVLGNKCVDHEKKWSKNIDRVWKNSISALTFSISDVHLWDNFSLDQTILLGQNKAQKNKTRLVKIPSRIRQISTE